MPIFHAVAYKRGTNKQYGKIKHTRRDAINWLCDVKLNQKDDTGSDMEMVKVLLNENSFTHEKENGEIDWEFFIEEL